MDDKSRQKTASVVGWIFAVIAVIWFLQFIANLYNAQHPRVPPIQGYNPHLVCDDAFKHDLHYENSTAHHIEIPMTAGCFSGFVHLPKTWTVWHTQPVGDQNGFWSAFWWANQPAPSGPYGMNSNAQFSYYPPYVFRLQGHGTILFYENVPDSPGTAQSAGPEPPGAKPLPPPIGPPKEAKAGDLTLGFWPCVHVGTTLLCRGYVRNDGDEKKTLQIVTDRAHVIDDAGKNHKMTEVDIGGRKCIGYCPENVYPRATALRISFSAPDVDPSVKKVTLIVSGGAFSYESQFDLAVEGAEEKPHD